MTKTKKEPEVEEVINLLFHSWFVPKQIERNISYYEKKAIEKISM